MTELPPEQNAMLEDVLADYGREGMSDTPFDKWWASDECTAAMRPGDVKVFGQAAYNAGLEAAAQAADANADRRIHADSIRSLWRLAAGSIQADIRSQDYADLFPEEEKDGM